MAFWKFLRRYWYIPFLAVGGIAAWILWRRWSPGPTLPPLEGVVKHVKAIKAGAEADKVRIEKGTEEAIAHVEKRYEAELKVLDAEKRAKAEKLRNNPEALTKFLVLGK